MHKVFALLCFVVVIHWLIFPYPSGLLHWHCGNLTIAPVPAKQPWWIWINTSCEFIMNDCITTTKQSTTKPCAYFLGYTVLEHSRCKLPYRSCKWRLFNGWTGPNSKISLKTVISSRLLLMHSDPGLSITAGNERHVSMKTTRIWIPYHILIFQISDYKTLGVEHWTHIHSAIITFIKVRTKEHAKCVIFLWIKRQELQLVIWNYAILSLFFWYGIIISTYDDEN